MDLNDHLVGLQFKRNKYGLSDWTATVKEVAVVWEWMSKAPIPHYKPVISVSSGTNYYGLDEIIFITSVKSV